MRVAKFTKIDSMCQTAGGSTCKFECVLRHNEHDERHEIDEHHGINEKLKTMKTMQTMKTLETMQLVCAIPLETKQQNIYLCVRLDNVTSMTCKTSPPPCCKTCGCPWEKMACANQNSCMAKIDGMCQQTRCTNAWQCKCRWHVPNIACPKPNAWWQCLHNCRYKLTKRNDNHCKRNVPLNANAKHIHKCNCFLFVSVAITKQFETWDQTNLAIAGQCYEYNSDTHSYYCKCNVLLNAKTKHNH